MARGDFQVVAEDVIEADLEGADAGAGPLTRLDLGDVALAVAAQAAQLIEFSMVAGADDAAVGGVCGGIGIDGAGQQARHVLKLIHGFPQLAQPRAREAAERAAQRRQAF